MDTLKIDQTRNTPKIIFDPVNNKFEITGASRPENVRIFYEPVVIWLENYYTEILDSIAKGKPVIEKFIIDIKLGYFNSSSAKFIHDALHRIHQLYDHGIDVKAKWYYDEGDDDMRQAGQDLSEMLDFPFIYHEIKGANK